VPDDFRTLLAEVAAGGATSLEAVHLWSLEAPEQGATDTTAALDNLFALTCGSALHLAQALASAPGGLESRLTLVTCGTQPVEPVGATLSVAPASI
jgi:hypothetical protein